MQTVTYQNVGECLVERIPEFATIFHTYLKEQDRQHLPHVLFGDFTRFVTQQFESMHTDPNAKDIVIRCLDFVEEILATGDAKLQDLVAASFLENLLESGNDRFRVIKSMKPYFGKTTLAMLNDDFSF